MGVEEVALASAPEEEAESNGVGGAVSDDGVNDFGREQPELRGVRGAEDWGSAEVEGF